MKKKLWLGVAVAVLLIVAVAWGYLGSTQEAELISVQEGSISRILNETGYVEAADDYEIQAQQYARIAEKKTAPGEKIAKGQLIIRMESPELQLEIKQSESQLAMTQGELSIARQSLSTLQIDLDNSQKNLTRQEQLHSAGAISEAEYERTESAVRNLREQLSQQELYLQTLNSKVQAVEGIVAQLYEKQAALEVLSPAKGIILDLPLKTGAYVVPGTLLAQVAVANKMEVKVELLSNDVKDVIPGQTAFITATVLGDKILEGKVKEIRPRAFTKVSALGVEQRRVPVIIELNEIGSLKTAYEVQVGIETASKEGVLLLPREAVQSTGNGDYKVMKVEAGKVKHCDIKVGLKNEEQVEVISGLQKGDTIVRDSSTDIKDGSRVKALK
ncbi:MAG: efflux RND transporter periplasmic adaptor subunit [Syntrophomonadaceae bacterium]|nr:efflux RND transporter periplasmic adaptor subunit [Syntrophomonadaceae bacterium]